ncbi:MAG TPA: VacJ family lipoprotein [Wenzhouxiangella sp.]
MTYLKQPIRGALALISLTLIIGCASTTKELTAPSPEDPWESTNRSIYAFNKGVDQVLLRPVAHTYDQITPKPAKAGISNFFDNLASPWVTSQLLLQGRFVDGSEQFGRFLINTVYGVGGLFDVADHNNLPNHETDLGATLATWGWKESRFVMLPLLGPATVRDGLGQITEMTIDPVDQALRDRTGPGITALNVIQMRAGFLGFDESLEDAYDEYAFVRDGWLQRRNFQLFGDDASLPDYDAFLEEHDDTPSP